MLTRRAAVVVAAINVGMAGATAGCTDGPAGQPVPGAATIGILTDQASEAGTEATQAATLAVELVNDRHPDVGLPLAGGSGLPSLAGARVRLVVGDTTGQPGGAEAAMDQLLAEPNLTGIIAADSAEVIATAGAYADRRQVPLVDAASSAEFLLEVGLDWYFRVTPSDRMLAEAAFALLAAEPPPGTTGKVTVFTSAAGGGADVAAALPELARGNGLEVTDTVNLDEEAPLLLAETAPDPVIAVAATAGEARQLNQALADSGAPRPVVGMGRGFGPERTMPVGMLYPAGWSSEFAQRHPLARAVTDLYQERYEAPMNGAAAAAFSATHALALAVDAAQATDPATVRAGLQQLSIPATQTIMPWNGLRFGVDGQNELAAPVVDQRTEQGSMLVYPPELAVTDVSWPSPPPPVGEGIP